MTEANETATEPLAGPVGSEGTGVAGEPGIAGDGGAHAAAATEDQLLDGPERGEPIPVGHGVVQDNVSDPGVQHTHEVDEDGAVVATSSHGGDEEVDEAEGELLLDGAAAKMEAERQGLLSHEEVESDEALVGAAGSAGANDGAGDEEALTGEEE